MICLDIASPLRSNLAFPPTFRPLPSKRKKPTLRPKAVIVSQAAHHVCPAHRRDCQFVSRCGVSQAAEQRIGELHLLCHSDDEPLRVLTSAQSSSCAMLAKLQRATMKTRRHLDRTTALRAFATGWLANPATCLLAWSALVIEFTCPQAPMTTRPSKFCRSFATERGSP